MKLMFFCPTIRLTDKNGDLLLIHPQPKQRFAKYMDSPALVHIIERRKRYAVIKFTWHEATDMCSYDYLHSVDNPAIKKLIKNIKEQQEHERRSKRCMCH